MAKQINWEEFSKEAAKQIRSGMRWSNVTGQDFIKVKLKMPGLKKLF